MKIEDEPDYQKVSYGISNPLPLLLAGLEPRENCDRRWNLFQETWGNMKSQIDGFLNDANSNSVNELRSFVKASWDRDPDAKIPTAIILPGSNIANHLLLFSQIYSCLKNESGIHVVTLTSKECPNLKVALKIIVAQITKGAAGIQQLKEEEELAEQDELHFDKRLRYDLDILAEWCRIQAKNSNLPLESRRIVVSIDDADSFDISILTDLISMTQSYISQIPFKLVLSVSTSLDVFESKLAKSAIRMIYGKPFYADITNGVQKIFNATILQFQPFVLGPKLFDALRTRQLESSHSVESAVTALKYICMSHFFSNPFSCIGLDEKGDWELVPRADYCKAARMLPSFRQFVETTLQENFSSSKSDIEKLLLDDEYFLNLFKKSVKEFREHAKSLIDTVNVVSGMQSILDDPVEKVRIYSQLITGNAFEIKVSDERDSVLARLEMMSLSGNKHAGEILSDSKNLQGSLDKLIKNNTKNIKSMLFSELFVVDNASLLESVFYPTYRPAIELALSKPSHYWGTGHESPHLSTLYRMYRESSVYINIYDYWMAFKESFGEQKNEPDFDRQSLAWFLHGISELKLLGVLRDCKRKFECVEKIAWNGL